MHTKCPECNTEFTPEELHDASLEDHLDPLYWKRISSGDQQLELNQTIKIKSEFKDNGVWVYEYEPLKLYAFGLSRSEALKSFKEEFLAVWEYIGKEDNENLTADALELKRHLQEILGKNSCEYKRVTNDLIKDLQAENARYIERIEELTTELEFYKNRVNKVWGEE